MSRQPSEKDPIECSGREEFAALYHAYQGMVRGVIYRIRGGSELDDLVQEAFLRIWQRKDQFRGEAMPKTWVYKIAVNVAIDHYRRFKRKPMLYVPEEIGAQNASQEKRVGDRDLVFKGLQALSVHHRITLVLHVMEGLSVAKVAEATEVNVGTVKSRLHHARKKLRAFLIDEGVSL